MATKWVVPNYHIIRALKWATVGTNVGIFVGWHLVLPPKEAQTLGPGEPKPDLDHPAYRAKIAARTRFMTDHFVLSQRNIDEGRYYTLLTSAFSHQNFTHLGINMYMLHQSTIFGALVGLSPLRLSALALTSALGGSVAQLLDYGSREGEHGVGRSALGASGMVQGMLVATACAAPLMPVFAMFIPIPIAYRTFVGGFLAWDAYNLYHTRSGNEKTNWMGSTVGYGAHLGGAVAGAAFYLVAMRRGKLMPARRSRS